jgi:hypothetical protein
MGLLSRAAEVERGRVARVLDGLLGRPQGKCRQKPPRTRRGAMSATQSGKHLIASRVEELKTLRDEIRLELHLASMELRDEWERIERELPDWSRAAEQVRDAAGGGMNLLVGQLRRFQAKLREEPRK